MLELKDFLEKSLWSRVEYSRQIYSVSYQLGLDLLSTVLRVYLGDYLLF